MSRVGSIDSEGIWYGLTISAWIPRASPRASATMMTSSRSAPWVLWGRGGLGNLSLLPRRGRRPPADQASSPPPPAPQRPPPRRAAPPLRRPQAAAPLPAPRPPPP